MCTTFTNNVDPGPRGRELSVSNHLYC